MTSSLNLKLATAYSVPWKKFETLLGIVKGCSTLRLDFGGHPKRCILYPFAIASTILGAVFFLVKAAEGSV